MIYIVLSPSQFKIECSLNEIGYISSSVWATLSLGEIEQSGNIFSCHSGLEVVPGPGGWRRQGCY